MSSTKGGCLIGFGLAILLMSLGGYSALTQYYGQIMQYRRFVEDLYNITHSEGYQIAMSALSTLSPHVERIADVLSNPLISWLGLGGLADSLRMISQAHSFME